MSRVAAALHITKPVAESRKHLFDYKFERSPRPINCMTFGFTRDTADDRTHPLHTKIRRQLAAFDSNKLHYSVTCSLDISKKATIRNWACRRVKEAFRQELRARGYASDGSPLHATRPEVVSEAGTGLKGALRIMLAKDPFALTATTEDVRSNCQWLLKRIIQAQQPNALRQLEHWGRNHTSRSVYETRSPNPHSGTR